MVAGLILSPVLTQRSVRVEMHFEPSVGILARKIDKLGLDIRSFREPLKRSVQQVVIPSIRMNFDSGGRPKWAPLSEDTIRRRGSAGPILIRSGALRRVATQLNIWTIDTEKALVTDIPSSVWYGKVHQAGGGGGSVTQIIRNPLTRRTTTVTEGTGGSIPARPFIMIQPEDEARIHQVFEEWLGERIRAAGLG